MSMSPFSITVPSFGWRPQGPVRPADSDTVAEAVRHRSMGIYLSNIPFPLATRHPFPLYNNAKLPTAENQRKLDCQIIFHEIFGQKLNKGKPALE